MTATKSQLYFLGRWYWVIILFIFLFNNVLSGQMDLKGTGITEYAKLSLLQRTLAKCHYQNVRTFTLLENYIWGENDA